MEATEAAQDKKPTVSRSERLDVELREMGYKYVGQYQEKAGHTKMFRYLAPNGKLLFVYDLGDNRGWDLFVPLAEAPDIAANLDAAKAYAAL